MEKLREIILAGERAENSAAGAQQRFGLPEGFMKDLLTAGDDWSFVIKLSALVETAITDHLIRTLNQPSLHESVSKLPLREKADWCGKLGALSGSRRQFVNELSAVRNRIAHQIRRIPNFRLADYLTNLEESRYVSLTGGPKPTTSIMIALSQGIERYGIWHSALHLIEDLEDNHRRSESEREQQFDAARRSEIEAILKLVDEAIADTDESMKTKT